MIPMNSQQNFLPQICPHAARTQPQCKYPPRPLVCLIFSAEAHNCNFEGKANKPNKKGGGSFLCGKEPNLRDKRAELSGLRTHTGLRLSLAPLGTFSRFEQSD